MRETHTQKRTLTVPWWWRTSFYIWLKVCWLCSVGYCANRRARAFCICAGRVECSDDVEWNVCVCVCVQHEWASLRTRACVPRSRIMRYRYIMIISREYVECVARGLNPNVQWVVVECTLYILQCDQCLDDRIRQIICQHGLGCAKPLSVNHNLEC